MSHSHVLLFDKNLPVESMETLAPEELILWNSLQQQEDEEGAIEYTKEDFLDALTAWRGLYRDAQARLKEDALSGNGPPALRPTEAAG